MFFDIFRKDLEFLCRWNLKVYIPWLYELHHKYFVFPRIFRNFQNVAFDESTKSSAWRAGSHALRAHVFTRSVCSRANVLVCFTLMRVYLLACLACSRAYVFTWLCFLPISFICILLIAEIKALQLKNKCISM